MKKYKPSFFLSQAFKGMFRNGMMTFASVVVLLACLTVLGCFSMLSENIDYNLDQLDSMNEIVAFSDTSTNYNPGDTAKLASNLVSTEGKEFLGWSLSRGAESPDYFPGQNYVVSSENAKFGVITFYAVWKGGNGKNGITINYDLSGVQISGDAPVDSEIYADNDSTTLLDAPVPKSSAIEFKGWSSVPNSVDPEFYGGDKYKVLTENAKGGVITLYAIWSDMPVYTSYSIVYDANSVNVADVPTDYQVRLDYVKSSIYSIDGLSDKNVEYVSREQTLYQEMKQLNDYPELAEFFTGGDNPYPDTFIITYSNKDDISMIESRLTLIKDIYKTRSRVDIAESVSGVKNGISMIFFWFAIVLFAVSVLVIINTVKLAVEFRSKEITIMRYIGATKLFIAVPFELEGMIIGIFAGAVSFAIQWLSYGRIAELITGKLEMISILPFKSISMMILAECLATGIVTGIIGSTISIWKYLKA